jgi:hypothetical protein
VPEGGFEGGLESCRRRRAIFLAAFDSRWAESVRTNSLSALR